MRVLRSCPASQFPEGEWRLKAMSRCKHRTPLLSKSDRVGIKSMAEYHETLAAGSELHEYYAKLLKSILGRDV